MPVVLSRSPSGRADKMRGVHIRCMPRMTNTGGHMQQSTYHKVWSMNQQYQIPMHPCIIRVTGAWFRCMFVLVEHAIHSWSDVAHEVPATRRTKITQGKGDFKSSIYCNDIMIIVGVFRTCLENLQSQTEHTRAQCWESGVLHHASALSPNHGIDTRQFLLHDVFWIPCFCLPRLHLPWRQGGGTQASHLSEARQHADLSGQAACQLVILEQPASARTRRQHTHEQKHIAQALRIV